MNFIATICNDCFSVFFPHCFTLPSLYLSICLSVCVPVCLSACLTIFLHIALSSLVSLFLSHTVHFFSSCIYCIYYRLFLPSFFQYLWNLKERLSLKEIMRLMFTSATNSQSQQTTCNINIVNNFIHSGKNYSLHEKKSYLCIADIFHWKNANLFGKCFYTKSKDVFCYINDSI